MDIKELAKFIVVGRVSSVHPEDATARVTFPAKDGKVSAPLSVLGRGSRSNKDYWMPDIDDQVLCIFAADVGGKGIGNGYILGTIFSSVDVPPASASATNRILETNGDLTISCGGTLSITSGSGDVTVNGISLVNHTHGGVTPGGGSTGKPQ